MAIMFLMDFSDWITRKYIEWRGDAIGNERSITKFAKEIGVNRIVLTEWMQKGGKIPRSSKTIAALVNHFGEEVYDVLGLPKPTVIQSYTPRTFRLRQQDAQREVFRRIRLAGLNDDDPEAEQIAIEVYREFGFRWSTTIPDDSVS